MPAVSDPPITATSSSSMRQLPALPNELLLLAEAQWLFSEAELLRTPSVLDGIHPDKERENRGKGVNFILQVGIMLKLPQITLATASVFLHRFYMRHSMVEQPGSPGVHYYTAAATSVFLATKVEENCRKMKELVVACVRVAQKDPNKVVDEQDKEYWRWKDTILHTEDVLLEALCFDLSLEPPYKLLYDFLAYFGEEDNKRLRNAAWAFVNDSCLTMLCLLFSSRTIAASAMYAAAKHCGVAFPDDGEKPWWEVMGVELKGVKRALNYMANVYESSPLKGSAGGSIYERTPENGDESSAKTRAVKRATERSPSFEAPIRTSGNLIDNNDTGNPDREEREDDNKIGGETAGTLAGSANGQDQDYDDSQGIPWGGDENEERASKRRKVEGENLNGVPEEHPTDSVLMGSQENRKKSQNGDVLASPAGDEGSEEGEVEP